jgi:hypothetical protein
MLDSLDRLVMALDPATMMEELGMTPDPWQARVLRSTAHRLLLLCGRQCGKSTATAILALHTTLFHPQQLVLLVSPSQRQSGELFRKVGDFYVALDRPVGAVQTTATTLSLANGSRVVSLPSLPATIRCYSGVKLLGIDEAAQVDDAVFVAVSPMLAASRGRLVAHSTPFGRRGWFHSAWSEEGPLWERVRATAEECPRISGEFLAEERRTLGERWYRQEYLCSFEETIDQVFSTESVLAAFDSTAQPLLLE